MFMIMGIASWNDTCETAGCYKIGFLISQNTDSVQEHALSSVIIFALAKS